MQFRIPLSPNVGHRTGRMLHYLQRASRTLLLETDEDLCDVRGQTQQAGVLALEIRGATHAEDGRGRVSRSRLRYG